MIGIMNLIILLILWICIILIILQIIKKTLLLYDPYKNYQYRILKATNKKEELLYNYLSYEFALQELDLYLDIYQNNQDMIKLYNKYLDESNKSKKLYEESFGPISLNSNYLNNNTWSWLNNSWPWEGTR